MFGVALIGMITHSPMSVLQSDCSPGPVSSETRNTAPRHGCAKNRESLQTTFLRSLPSVDWAQRGRDRLVVALIDLHDWKPWRSDAPRLLNPTEIARVQRRYIKADREALALTYALHRLLLASALDMDPADVPLSRDRHGCPRVGSAAAQGCNTMHGRRTSTSLSHAGGFAALAITATGPVGVDIEPNSRASVMPEIAARVCAPGEAVAVLALAEPMRSAALLALWVRKEALLKAAGVGLACEMSGFHAPPGTVLRLPVIDGACESPTSEAGTGGARITEIRMLDAGPRCLSAVAGAPGVRVESAWLRPHVE